jgi:tetratricopeptide (TPR) repeat protein
MISKAEGMAVKDVAPSPGEAPRGTAGDSQYLRDVMQTLDAELGRSIQEANRAGQTRRLVEIYFDLQKFDLALQNMQLVLRNEKDNYVRGGGAYYQYARICAMAGKPDQARQAAAEFEKRMMETWMVGRHKRLVAWLDALADRKSEVEKLDENVRTNPLDGESRWRALTLYRDAVPLRLDELAGLVRLRELCPDYAAVKGGDCDWRLMDVMWHFGLRAEAFKMAEGFGAKYPDSSPGKSGDLTYRLADYSEQLGRNAEALALFRQIYEKFPEHWANGRGQDGTTRIERKIVELKGRVGR